LLIDVVPKLAAETASFKVQDDEKATYTKIISKADGKIDWKNSAEQIERQARAYDPWPGAYSIIRSDDKYNNKILKIYKSFVLEQTKNGPFGDPGKTYLAANDKIAIMSGKHFLVAEELQLEGGKRILTGEFLAGHKDFIGVMLA